MRDRHSNIPGWPEPLFAFISFSRRFSLLCARRWTCPLTQRQWALRWAIVTSAHQFCLLFEHFVFIFLCSCSFNIHDITIFWINRILRRAQREQMELKCRDAAAVYPIFFFFNLEWTFEGHQTTAKMFGNFVFVCVPMRGMGTKNVTAVCTWGRPLTLAHVAKPEPIGVNERRPFILLRMLTNYTVVVWSTKQNSNKYVRANKSSGSWQKCCRSFTVHALRVLTVTFGVVIGYDVYTFSHLATTGISHQCRIVCVIFGGTATVPPRKIHNRNNWNYSNTNQQRRKENENPRRTTAERSVPDSEFAQGREHEYFEWSETQCFRLRFGRILISE